MLTIYKWRFRLDNGSRNFTRYEVFFGGRMLDRTCIRTRINRWVRRAQGDVRWITVTG